MTITCPRCAGKGTIELPTLVMLRQRRSLDQKDVADALGISQSAYSRMEKRGRPGWRYINTLADFYGVTAGQITGREALPSGKERTKRAPDEASLERSRQAKIGKAKKQLGRRIVLRDGRRKQ